MTVSCPPGYEISGILCTPLVSNARSNPTDIESLNSNRIDDKDEKTSKITAKDRIIGFCGTRTDDECLNYIPIAAKPNKDKFIEQIKLDIDFVLKEFCSKDNARACRMYAMGQTDLDRRPSAATFHLKSCNLGNNFSCLDYVALATDMDWINNEYSEISKIKLPVDFIITCDHLYRVDCSNLARAVNDGALGITKDTVKAAQLYEISCQKGELNSCIQLAQIYTNKSLKTFNPTKGIALLERACNLNSAESCAKLGAIYIDNVIIAQNSAKALSFAQKSCSMKNTHGCSIAKHIERSLEDNRLRQAELQRKRDEDIRRAQQDRERERCLSNGPVGVCFKWVDSPRINVCNNGDLGTIIDFVNAINPLEYSQCYVRDTNSIAVYATVRNNHPYTIKDLKISCQMSAESGTSLGGGSETFLKLFPPGKQVDVQFKIFRRNQVNTLSCKSTSWRQ